MALEHLNKTTYDFSGPFLDSILAVLQQDPDFIPGYRNAVAHTFFKEPVRKLICEQLLAHYDQYYTVPSREVLELRVKAACEVRRVDFTMDHKKRIRTICEKDIAGDKPFIVEQVLHFGKFSALRDAMKEGLIALKEPEKWPEIVEKINEASLVDTSKTEWGTFWDEGFEARMAWRKQVQKFAVRTGMPDLDKALGGGFKFGQLIVILAGTNIGKTTFAANLAHGCVAAGGNVLFLSTELVENWIHDKIDAKIAKTPSLELVDDEERAIRRLEKFANSTKGRLHVKWFEPYSATLQQMRQYWKEMKKIFNFHPDLIILDSPDLAKAPRHRQKINEAISDIYTEVFAWATSSKVPLVVTSDVKQESLTKKIITRRDAGLSYEKIKKCDVLIGIGQDDELRRLDQDGYNHAWVNLDKSRQGAPGTVLLAKCANKRADWQIEGPVDEGQLRKAQTSKGGV